MKIIVFGSTGGTGLKVIEQALEQGHEVTAFARNPAKLNLTHYNLSTIQGDILNPISVTQAIDSHDAVVCTLGMKNIMDASGLRNHGTKHIVQAMESTNVSRLVCLSALGTGDSYCMLPSLYKYLLAPLLMKRLYADHLAQESHIKNSNLEWVIIRPATLTNGRPLGSYHYGNTDCNLKIKAKVSRADTAAFIVTQLTNNEFLRKIPFISY